MLLFTVLQDPDLNVNYLPLSHYVFTDTRMTSPLFKAIATDSRLSIANFGY